MTKSKTKSDLSPTTTLTLRNPPYTYIHLRLITLSQPRQQQPLDELTIRAHLTSALQAYLGLTGTAISIDILKVEDQNTWIRIPRDDEVAVVAAVSQWVGAKGVSLRIESRGSWLGGVIAHGRKGKVWSLEEG